MMEDRNPVIAAIPHVASLLLVSLLGHFVEAMNLAMNLWNFLLIVGRLKAIHAHWDEQYIVSPQGSAGFSCSATIVSSGF